MFEEVLEEQIPWSAACGWESAGSAFRTGEGARSPGGSRSPPAFTKGTADVEPIGLPSPATHDLLGQPT
jgi:hypothetical protein